MAAEEITNITNRGQITNPYDREHRAEYNMGNIERFLHDKLGFRTGYDTYHENMDNASAAWLAQQENNAYEEQYNSAEAQAQRMREAGLNPDIAPNTVAAGEATEFTEPESAPESPAGIDVEAFEKATQLSTKIASVALDAITGSAGLFSTITNTGMDLAKGAIELDTKEANLGQQLRQMANEAYGELEPQFSKLASSGLAGADKWGAKVMAGAGDFLAKTRGLSGRNKSKFAYMYNSQVNSATAKWKTAEKKANVTSALANPAVQAPEQYKAVEMLKFKWDTETYKCALKKAEYENEVLKENKELFKGMTTAQMRRTINEAIKSGNEAEIAKYNKAIAKLDAKDRENEQEQLDIDRKYIKEFQYNPIVGMWEYTQAINRIYKSKPQTLKEATFGF